MLKKICSLALMLAMLVSSAAVAEVTNRDMQMMGGVVVSNGKDSFFFCPMEEGLSRHWGLYAVSSCANGPILEIKDGYPARLIHADSKNVYFLGYTDANRTVHSLYSVPVDGGTPDELLKDIAHAYVLESDSFYYVTSENPYCLRRYNIETKKTLEIKDMTKSDKKIYDAVKAEKDDIYFLTTNKNGGEDGYEYHASSRKATNLDKPNPGHFTSILYEGYRIYSVDHGQSQLYSVKIGNKKAVKLAADGPAVWLNSPRFGQYIYGYDGESNTLVGYLIDGSDRRTLTLDGPTLSRLMMGGSKDEIFFYSGSAIYSAPADLSSKTKVIDFNMSTGGLMWTHIAPAGSAILLMGYGPESLTHQDTMLPTGVYAYDRTTGEELFAFPIVAESAEGSEGAAGTENATPVDATRPETLGDAPAAPREENETYFVF